MYSLGCRSREQYVDYFDPQKKHVMSRGETRNNKEDGKWVYYNEEGSVIEEGKCTDGFLEGKWSYPILKSEISWKKSEKGDLAINLPDHLKKVESSDFFYVATNLDTVNTENLIIAFSSVKDFPTLKLYKQALIDDLKNTVDITATNCQQLSSKTSESYSLKFLIKKENKELLVFTFIGKIGDKILDISYSVPNSDLNLKYTVFAGIVQHCYLKDQRLINPFEASQVVDIPCWE